MRSGPRLVPAFELQRVGGGESRIRRLAEPGFNETAAGRGSPASTAGMEGLFPIASWMLVHQNFSAFALEKTAEEVYETYRLAVEFVDWFPQELRAFCRRTG